MSDLMLVPIARKVDPITTAVLYYKEARAYLRISAGQFHKLVSEGVLVRRVHVGGKRPFFLKHELDDYLFGTPQYRMGTKREVPLATKGEQ